MIDIHCSWSVVRKEERRFADDNENQKSHRKAGSYYEEKVE
jgi:hypothetical protein